MAIGSIEIDILANTAKLVKGMTKAEFTVKNSMRTMTKAVGAFAAIFVGGQMIGKISATAAGLDKIGKTSSKLGITAEALQALHLGAEEAGISTNTLDMAVQRMTRRVAEAARGTGEAVGALNELGISAEDLAAMTPDDMLRRVADSMVNVTSQSDKVRLSMKLFDSEGVAMVNMLKDGSRGLDDTAAKAQRLGLIVSGDLIKSMEKYNDTLNISKRVIDTVWKGITVGLSLSLQDLVKDLNKGSENLDIFGTSLNMTKQVVYGLGRGFEILSTSISTAVAGYTSLYALGKLIVAANFGGDEVQAQKEFNAAVADAVVKSTAWKNAINGTSIAALALKSTLETPIDNSAAVASVDAVNNSIKTQGDLWSEVKAASKDYYTNLSNNTTTAKSVVSALNSTISSGFTSAFRQAMDGTTEFKEHFKNMAKDVIAQLINILLVQRAVAQALSSIGFGSSSVAPMGPLRVDGAMADGGLVKSGSSFLVGENGPEIVSLPKGANVTPNGSAPLGDSGTNVSVNVINNAGVGVDVEQEGDNISIIIDTISNQIIKGTGNFSSALENRYGLKKT